MAAAGRSMHWCHAVIGTIDGVTITALHKPAQAFEAEDKRKQAVIFRHSYSEHFFFFETFKQYQEGFWRTVSPRCVYLVLKKGKLPIFETEISPSCQKSS